MTDNFQKRLDRNEPLALLHKYGHPGAFYREHERANRLFAHIRRLQKTLFDVCEESGEIACEDCFVKDDCVALED